VNWTRLVITVPRVVYAMGRPMPLRSFWSASSDALAFTGDPFFAALAAVLSLIAATVFVIAKWSSRRRAVVANVAGTVLEEVLKAVYQYGALVNKLKALKKTP
jgi:hypothetical protein